MRITLVLALTVGVLAMVGCSTDDAAVTTTTAGGGGQVSAAEFCERIAGLGALVGEPPADATEFADLRVKVGDFVDGAPEELREPLSVWSELVLYLGQTSVDGGDLDAAEASYEDRDAATQALETLRQWTEENCPGAGGPEMSQQEDPELEGVLRNAVAIAAFEDRPLDQADLQAAFDEAGSDRYVCAEGQEGCEGPGVGVWWAREGDVIGVVVDGDPRVLGRVEGSTVTATWMAPDGGLADALAGPQTPAADPGAGGS